MTKTLGFKSSYATRIAPGPGGTGAAGTAVSEGAAVRSQWIAINLILANGQRSDEVVSGPEQDEPRGSVPL